VRAILKRPYLLVITNLFCNHQCSYCIQEESSLVVRKNAKKVDVPALLRFLKRNRIDRCVNVMGGEATIHPDFDELVVGLGKLYRKIRITTNVNGAWYEDFGRALERMTRFGSRVQWNTTYHPAWMNAEVYIERIRAMKSAGVNVVQVTTTDTDALTDELARKLHEADIGWTVQPFTGRSATGELRPRTWDHVRTEYPLLYDPSWYIERYDEYAQECEDANYSDRDYRPEWVQCTTPRFLIGPDNNVYPCHRHLYVEDQRYACGNIHDVRMKGFRFKWSWLFGRWTLPCDTKCNPCDFQQVKVESLGRPNALYRELEEAATG
jgi:radical SAM protein with 4Fe4S-binding SPASM domain